ncbi:MAG: helix-hairpin-helix domain-containing protein [Bacteroidales bacterium]|nr:helix-hairpin-helix domain-containing protein [Bacteroidales bacterium]
MNGLFSPREPRLPAGAPDARTPEQGSGSARVRPTAASFKVGAIALAFLILGYQTALFVTRAAGLKLAANRDRPDTVYVYLPVDSSGSGVGSPDRSHPRLRKREGPASDGSGRGPAQQDVWRTELPTGAIIERRNAPHTPRAEAYRRATRRVESFRFDPNTVSVEDLIRLGFSEKQAQAIDNYRTKGGRFRRKADFARSFVVADSVFRRLERFIDIPKVDLNRADSAALDALPGIGPWYAARIVSYRAELGGYSYPEQLMDIYRFDREKYDALSDLVFCSPPAPFALWSLPADSLRLHPYIRSAQAARSIVLFRDHTPREGWTVAALGEAGILPPEDASRLARCRLSPP